jgi:hypothetical protein
VAVGFKLRTCRSGFSPGTEFLAKYLLKSLYTRQVVFPVPLLPRIRLAESECLIILISSSEISNGNSASTSFDRIELMTGSVRE